MKDQYKVSWFKNKILQIKNTMVFSDQNLNLQGPEHAYLEIS
jgi:hypothetical protein